MREVECWRENIRCTLTRMGDEAYQRAAWFNQHAEVSSPDELINQLYDDYQFDLFIVDAQVGLSSDFRRLCREFSDLLEKFIKETPTVLDPYKVIDDSRWNEIRKCAAAMAKHL